VVASDASPTTEVTAEPTGTSTDPAVTPSP
jgi:hypothetical protein